MSPAPAADHGESIQTESVPGRISALLINGERFTDVAAEPAFALRLGADWQIRCAEVICYIKDWAPEFDSRFGSA